MPGGGRGRVGRGGAAGPGPGGAQDEGQEQHLESDGEAVEVEVGPGLPYRVVHRDGDVERCYDEVDGAVDTGGQCRGEQDHEDRAEPGQPWTATYPVLLDLCHLGIPPDSPVMLQTAHLVARNCRWEYDGRPFFPGEGDCC